MKIYEYTYCMLIYIYIYTLIYPFPFSIIFPACYPFCSHTEEKYFPRNKRRPKDPKNKTDMENEKKVKTVEGITDGVFLPQTVLHFIPQPIPQ